MKLRLSILCLSVTLMSFLGVNALAGLMRVGRSLVSRFETDQDQAAHHRDNPSPYTEDNSEQNENAPDGVAELPHGMPESTFTCGVTINGELLPAPPKGAEKRFLELCSILI